MWGWSVIVPLSHSTVPVFPTRVGMVRLTLPSLFFGDCFPHACGDGPYLFSTILPNGAFSPRVWGWSVIG